MKYLIIVLGFTLIACNSNSKKSTEVNSTEISDSISTNISVSAEITESETFTKAKKVNAQASSTKDKSNFINHMRKHIDFSKCIPYADEKHEDLSKEKRNAVESLHNAISSKGIKLYTPIEIMEYEGNSSEIAYSLEDIEGISSVFHEIYEEVFEEAKVFIKDNKFETNSEEYYANGNIKRVSKSYKGKYEYNSFNYENFEDGTLMSLYVTADDKYNLIYTKDYDGKLQKKELKIKAGYFPAFAFSEQYNRKDKWVSFYLGSSLNVISAAIDNSNQLTRLKHRVSCWCPQGENPDYGNKLFSTTLIDYNIDSYSGKKEVFSYWDSGVYFNGNKKYDLNNNSYEDISYRNEAKKDTSELTIGKINISNRMGQNIIYGENPFTDGVTLVKKTRWERENGSKYKYMEVFYDDKGQEKETVFYFPNGNVKERR